MRTAPAVLALCLLVGTSACSGDDDFEPTTAAEPVTSAPAAPAPAPTTSEPAPRVTPTTRAVTPAPPRPGVPFPADTSVDTGRGTTVGTPPGEGLVVQAVRTGRQSGYDRVVFELSGTGTPQWRVEYVDEARADGSGDLVPLEGETVLQVVLLNMRGSADGGPTLPRRVAGSGTASVTEVAPGGVFEGQRLAFIGLDGGQKPFRVQSLDDPPRVVVDVRDR